MENVGALLVRGIDRVLGDLAESGYDAEWTVLPAAAFGAPHLRKRVFIVANSNITGLEGRVFGGERARKQLARSRSEAEQTVWKSSTGIRRVAHGVSKRVDRIKCLGNAIVPPAAEFIGRRLIEVDEAML